MIDPRSLLTSDEELERCQALLQQFQDNNNTLPDGVTDEDLWQAKRTTDVRYFIHPAFFFFSDPKATGLVGCPPS